MVDTARMRTPRPILSACAVTLLFGCATPPPEPEQSTVPDEQVCYRAESGRTKLLEREVERLRSDLAAAEDALVAAESGLRGDRSRADAVSALAEAHIQVDRARERAPWLDAQISEADEKLSEAESQISVGNLGAAIFFSWRAQRIAERSLEEASRASSEPSSRIIRGRRVNLREGPSTEDAVLTVLTHGMPVFLERELDEWILVRTTSGEVGWVHASLVQ